MTGDTGAAEQGIARARVERKHPNGIEAAQGLDQLHRFGRQRNLPSVPVLRLFERSSTALRIDSIPGKRTYLPRTHRGLDCHKESHRDLSRLRFNPLARFIVTKRQTNPFDFLVGWQPCSRLRTRWLPHIAYRVDIDQLSLSACVFEDCGQKCCRCRPSAPDNPAFMRCLRYPGVILA